MNFANRIVGSETVPIAELIKNPRNWRRHPLEQKEAMKGILSTVGWVDRIMAVKDTKTLVDGHLRLEIAIENGEETAEVDWVDLTPDEADLVLATFDPVAAMAIADRDNLTYLLDKAETDDAGIKNLLAELARQEGISRGAGTVGTTDPDDVPEPPKIAITQPGDVWLMGPHRLLCGDSENPAHVERLMAGHKADLIVADPPYGVSLRLENAHEASNAAKGVDVVYRHFEPIQNDHLDGPAIQRLVENALRIALWASNNRAAIYVWHAWATQEFTAAAMRNVGILTNSQIIWVKPHFVFGRNDYHWQHEPCYYGWKKSHRPPFYGERNQSTIWTTDVGGGSIRKDQDHPTEKPVSLFERPIENHTRHGEIVYDPFAGSGSVTIAGEMHGRSVYAMELAPIYCDVIVKRWEKFTGKTAIHEKFAVNTELSAIAAG